MPKVLISIDEKLLRQLDRAAKRAGLSRSAYIARLAARDLAEGTGPGADPEARKAIADIQRLFSENPPPPGFDWTAEIRKMRDSR
jgi:metal-responsive CopG/Arc/MetJ family transcriptional regulator